MPPPLYTRSQPEVVSTWTNGCGGSSEMGGGFTDPWLLDTLSDVLPGSFKQPFLLVSLESYGFHGLKIVIGEQTVKILLSLIKSRCLFFKYQLHKIYFGNISVNKLFLDVFTIITFVIGSSESGQSIVQFTVSRWCHLPDQEVSRSSTTRSFSLAAVFHPRWNIQSMIFI